MQHDMFETPGDRVRNKVGAPSSAVFARLLEQDPMSASEIRGLVRRHMEHLEAAARDEEFLDLMLGRRLADQCLSLIGFLESDPPEAARRLAQAAILYFTLDDDAANDSRSILGLDDDARVLEATFAELDLDGSTP